MDTMQELKKIMSDYKGSEVNFTSDSSLEELDFDSLDQVDLMMQMEDAFNITFGDDVQITTIGELVKLVDELK